MTNGSGIRTNPETQHIQDAVDLRMDRARAEGRVRILNPWLCEVQTGEAFDDFVQNKLAGHLATQAAERQARLQAGEQACPPEA